MPNELSKEQLQRLARLGAQARLEELDAERSAIIRTFPGLTTPGSRQRTLRGSEAPGAEKAAVSGKAKRRRRKKMSAAQKKAQSERMKQIWAERRKTGS